MKKYIIPLTIILLLVFTLTGFCWVAGYDQRVKLTIDQTKIDTANLTNFPVTAFFTDAQAEEIFAEFDADEDFDRGQFALSDDTLLKAEKELFDDSESKGIYHIKIPTVLYNADTDYYFYYDNDADHNTSYIGIIGSATAAEVWDEWFSLVVHGADNTTSSVLDSTSNNNDGTKTDANEPIETDVKVGKGQDFDGTNDSINIGNGGDYTTDVTIEVISRLQNVDSENTRFISKYKDAQNRFFFGWITSLSSFLMLTEVGDTIYQRADAAYSPDEDGIYYVAAVIDNGTANYIYVNGAAQELTNESKTTGDYSIDQDAVLGRYNVGYDETELDEVRVSTSVRTAAWIKATYNSLWDTLLTYGSEETPTGIVWNGVTITKWNGITITKINGN